MAGLLCTRVRSNGSLCIRVRADGLFVMFLVCYVSE